MQPKVYSTFIQQSESALERVFPTQGKDKPQVCFATVRARMEKLLGGKDLIAYQRHQDSEIARLVADNYVRSVVIELDKDGMQWSENPRFDEYLTRKFGVRKIIVAAGKSTRISPGGLIHKQIIRADGYNTNIKLARSAASFGNKEDVVVVDHLVGYHILSDHPVEADMRHSILVKIKPEFDEIFAKEGKGAKGIGGKMARWQDGNFSLAPLTPCQLALIPLRDEICDIIENNLFFASSSQQRDAASTVNLIASAISNSPLCKRGVRGDFLTQPHQAEYILDEIAYIIFNELIKQDEKYIDVEKRNDLIGGNCIVAIAKSYGPGGAYVAGVEWLKQLGLADDTKYTIPVYSDYAPALLDEYPNIYFHLYLQALSYFITDGTELFITAQLPVITIGGKSPLDKVRDRGNIIFVDTKYGLVPYAIEEWRDMTPQQQAEAEARLEESRRTGNPPLFPPVDGGDRGGYPRTQGGKYAHALNAGCFVIDTQWAIENFPLLKEKYNHPDEKKGKLFEYWYTDFVKIAAEEDRKLRAENPDAPPRSRIVFLGEDAPSGNKDVLRTLEFQSRLHKMIRNRLLELGITVDENARISIGSRNADVDFDRDLQAIFGNTVEQAAKPVPIKIIDQIYIFGDVYLETSVRVKNGTVLDGRGGKAVVLKGNTVVGSGVGLKSVSASDTVFEGHPRLDGFSYRPPTFSDMGTYSKIIDSNFETVYVEFGAEVIGTNASNYRIEGCVKRDA
ncbi:hypothetical protein FJZ31_06830 [Candidatus Poribacteria bacterium]|nr:hypothetical protein [Candidatus Poribacteria bacterium]